MAAISAPTVRTIPLQTLDVPSGLGTIQHGINLPGGRSRETQESATARSIEQHPSTAMASRSNDDGYADPIRFRPRTATGEDIVKAKSVFSFLVGTRLGNAIAIIGLLATLGPTLFQAITSYMDMKWSEHANAVQTCASLYSIGRFPEFCNATIEIGMNRTPLARRWIMPLYDTGHYINTYRTAMILATTMVCTTAALIFGTVYSRPRMQVFQPFLSHARLETVKRTPLLGHVRLRPDSRSTTGTISQLSPLIAGQYQDLGAILPLIKGFVSVGSMFQVEKDESDDAESFAEPGPGSHRPDHHTIPVIEALVPCSSGNNSTTRQVFETATAEALQDDVNSLCTQVEYDIGNHLLLNSPNAHKNGSTLGKFEEAWCASTSFEKHPLYSISGFAGTGDPFERSAKPWDPLHANLWATIYEQGHASALSLLAERRKSSPTYRDPATRFRRYFQSRKTVESQRDSARWTYSQSELDSALLHVIDTGKTVAIAAALLALGARTDVLKYYEKLADES